MNWLLGLSTRTKFVASFGLMLLALVAVIWLAQMVMAELLGAQKLLFDREFVSTSELIELRSTQNRQSALTLQLLIETEPAELERIERELADGARRTDLLVGRLRERLSGDPSTAARLDELVATVAAERETRREQIALVRAGKREQAHEIGLGTQIERFDRIRDIALDLAEEAKRRASQSVADSERRITDTMRLFVAIGIAAVLLCAAIAAFLNRFIAAPLKDITARAERIAGGEAAVEEAATPRRDEIGLLEEKFNQMAQSLRDKAEIAARIADGDLGVQVAARSERDALGIAFARMVANLRGANGEIGEGVNVLASSASEILAGMSQIAAGAAQTATATAETATTVEEVKQTAILSSQKAKAVAEIAQQASDVSGSGRRAVDDTAEGMQRIREQMEEIADSIVRLAEQGQAIGEIIAAVNDLAEQSNLLAVNASIEAAKAGEFGKGFAVVAQEVKSLAGQSKQATAQVRAILGDIQKATSGAVLATEQGSKAVEAGVRRSQEAGESIRRLADSIGECAQAASQIAVSAQQQLAGMDQLAVATDNIRVATAQNLDSSRQAEGAVHDLHALGQRLQELVGRYRF